MDQPPLQHDPRTKRQLSDALYDFLYKPVQQRFKARLDTIIVNNMIRCGYSHRSFVYKGELYTCEASPGPRRANRLHPELVADMTAYLDDLKALNQQEIPYVVGFITQVLNSTNHFPDYLHLLPESLHPPLYKLLSTCPCNARHLADDEIAALRTKNEASIALVKQRMVLNLIT